MNQKFGCGIWLYPQPNRLLEALLSLPEVSLVSNGEVPVLFQQPEYGPAAAALTDYPTSLTVLWWICSCSANARTLGKYYPDFNSFVAIRKWICSMSCCRAVTSLSLFIRNCIAASISLQVVSLERFSVQHSIQLRRVWQLLNYHLSSGSPIHPHC